MHLYFCLDIEYSHFIDSAPVPSHGNCTRLQTDDYVELLWTTGAEFPGQSDGVTLK